MATHELTWTQRLIAWTVLSNQRGSITDIRAINRILDVLALDNEAERQMQMEARIRHTLWPNAESLGDSDGERLPIDLTEDQAQKLGRYLQQWQQWTPADVQSARNLLDALASSAPAQLKRGRADCSMLLSAGTRLQLCFFAKQFAGPLTEAGQWAVIAAQSVLEDREIFSIRFRAMTNGQCSWNAAAAAALEPRMVEFTPHEADLILQRIETHEGWTPSDSRWVEEIVSQLKETNETEISLKGASNGRQ